MLPKWIKSSLEENWNLKLPPKPEIAVVVEQPRIDEPTAEEMARIDEAIASGRVRDKYCGGRGWLVIPNDGHPLTRAGVFGGGTVRAELR